MSVVKFISFASMSVVYSSANLATNFVLLKYFGTPLILTYVVVYLLTVLLAYLLNSHYTFKDSLSFKKAGLYYLTYLSSMLIGILLLSGYKYFLNFENWVYPFMVFPVTMLWNFMNENRFMKPAKE
jgi:putative flippase GtrA